MDARSLDDVLADGYVLVVDDGFDGHDLDPTRWLPHHLPQWSSRQRSVARYDLVGDTLQLRIDDDQPPWCPEFDGATRVSSLQTGVFAGPLGSQIGQHRFNDEAVVRELQDEARLFTPMFGVFTLRAQALLDPSCMVALWMIGYEDRPERSGVIDVVEIFGRDATAHGAKIGMNLQAFADPDLVDDQASPELPIDVREFHEYTVQWTPDDVTFFVDGSRVRRIEQSPHYPMQFMLGIYEFDEPSVSDSSYPKRFVVDHFRAYEPRR